MNEEWKDKLTKAGSQFDGHVTIGSLEEQSKLVDEMLSEQKKVADEMFAAFVNDIRQIGHQCLAGGHKARNRMFQSLANRYEYIYKTHKLDILQWKFDGKGDDK